VIDLWAFLHIAGVASFLLFHGVQVWALFAIPPAFPDREKMFDRAEQSRMAGTPMYASLGALALFGVIAGIDGSWFSHGWWLWGAIVVLLATTGAMSAMAGPYMRSIREATTRWADGTYPVSDEDLEALVEGPRGRLIAAIGVAGLAILLWLMVYKPGA
jgi:hypothetical protein